MTTRSRKKTSTPTNTSATIYEVKKGQRASKIQASTTQDLRKQLAHHLPEVTPYSLQGIAHLVSVDRVLVQAANWSVRRIGVMQYVPDEVPQPLKNADGSLSSVHRVGTMRMITNNNQPEEQESQEEARQEQQEAVQQADQPEDQPEGQEASQEPQEAQQEAQEQPDH